MNDEWTLIFSKIVFGIQYTNSNLSSIVRYTSEIFIFMLWNLEAFVTAGTKKKKSHLTHSSVQV